MGYCIMIGNAAVHVNEDDKSLEIRIEKATNVLSPSYENCDTRSNVRCPSYSWWYEFCEDAGISELFYGVKPRIISQNGYRCCPDNFHRETALIREGLSNIELISQDDLDYIRKARIRRERSNGGKPPGFFICNEKTNWHCVDNGVDPTLARLLWLEFWMDWALKNCAFPSISIG